MFFWEFRVIFKKIFLQNTSKRLLPIFELLIPNKFVHLINKFYVLHSNVITEFFVSDSTWDNPRFLWKGFFPYSFISCFNINLKVLPSKEYGLQKKLLYPHSGYIKIDAYLLQFLCHRTSDVKFSHILFFLIYIAVLKLYSTN